MERLVILLLLILMLVTRYGRRKLGEAYCAAAKYAPTLELRRDFSRKAVLAADHQPLKVFKRKKIPCVFTDYYFPSRYNPYLS